jgi:NDP-sugar pyrophosphorylase family protein
MKAVLLAAGLGTRLRPLTNSKPKVMVEVKGKPVLWYQVRLLEYYGISDIWINVHWLPDEVVDYFGDGSRLGVKINYSYGGELLGTAGTLLNPQSGIEEDLRGGSFLVVYGDHVTDLDYDKLVAFHRRSTALMSLSLYRSDIPWEKGVVETDGEGRVLWMKEKPARGEIRTDQVSAGIYVCEPGVLRYIPDGFSDWGKNVIPKILSSGERLYGWDTGAYLEDVGAPEGLEKVRRDVKQGLVRFLWEK